MHRCGAYECTICMCMSLCVFRRASEQRLDDLKKKRQQDMDELERRSSVLSQMREEESQRKAAMDEEMRYESANNRHNPNNHNMPCAWWS